jgi:hypothetical protein
MGITLIEPEDAAWWDDVDTSGDMVRVSLNDLSPSWYKSIAYYVGESATWTGAIRMAVSNGVYILHGSEPTIEYTAPEDPSEIPEPTVPWWDGTPQEPVDKEAELTIIGARELASVTAEYPSLSEAVRFAINVALHARPSK